MNATVSSPFEAATKPPTRAALEWPFPEPSTEELLSHLTNPSFAIAFALKKLPGHETAAFLRDWQEHRDLKPWVEAMASDTIDW